MGSAPIMHLKKDGLFVHHFNSILPFFWQVPQQENSYDCGYDTLYNIERIIAMGVPDNLEDLQEMVNVLLDYIKYLLSYNKDFSFWFVLNKVKVLTAWPLRCFQSMACP
jgi:hypothetical protein